MRVARAARSLDIETVSVYSDVDKYSSHLRVTDFDYCLGGGPMSRNYLNIEKILIAAEETSADAIHPGYGFLSESVEFAQEVVNAGLTWIGPPPEAISLLGDKVVSRDVASQVGLETTPGSEDGIENRKEAVQSAKSIGYPLMVKAAFGGGGLGMRVVRNNAELKRAIKDIKHQSTALFGKGKVFLEKYVEDPKHIEIQFFLDKSGNGVHLFERECSLQRRYQKVLEEAPSTALNDEMRTAIGKSVIELATKVNYSNAGTAEFLFKDGALYFNEVNARLQVEHPVTEMITGTDLVVEQILVATGKNLSWKQSDLSINGHSIEARIYAEDPLNNFAPSPGTVRGFITPGGAGVRFDSHIYAGYTVPNDYDPLLGKLISWGNDREQAISRLNVASRELGLSGFRCNQLLFPHILEDKEFIAGNIHIRYLESSEILKRLREEKERDVAALFVTGLTTRKRYYPTINGSKWRDTARREGVS